MSLPDTVFIFVLALIIFGPKKLPEIGRQIGRLVGEFRRASNDFKFQIEEELRQADVLEKRSAPPEISKPVTDAREGIDSGAVPVVAEETGEVAETLPVGQYPNLATLDVSELDPAAPPAFEFNGSGTVPEIEEPANETRAGEAESSTPPIEITAAPGSQPRTNPPFVAAVQDTDSFLQPSLKPVVPANRPSAQAEAEVTHG